jgi:hypothetical protein
MREAVLTSWDLILLNGLFLSMVEYYITMSQVAYIPPMEQKLAFINHNIQKLR